MAKEKKENLDLCVYLGPLKKPWADYCDSLGKKPGAAIREAIEQQLESSKPNPKNFRQKNEDIGSEGKKRFEVLLTTSERKALAERAALENCSQRQWVIDAIRAGLTKEPQFGMKEIEILGESNYQLLAIGRNLNQIAKAMNEGRKNSVSVTAIEELRKQITIHTSKVSRAIRASLERWEIK